MYKFSRSLEDFFQILSILASNDEYDNKQNNFGLLWTEQDIWRHKLELFQHSSLFSDILQTKQSRKHR